MKCLNRPKEVSASETKMHVEPAVQEGGERVELMERVLRYLFAYY